MKTPTTRKRHPDETRAAILEAAFWEIHRHGFQAASLERIIAKTGVTKGALYHHFPSKVALGYAVIDDVIAPHFTEKWRIVAGTDDPITAIQNHFERAAACLDDEELTLGCPLNNLAQEMSPIDEGFRTRIERLFELWRSSIARLLDKGVKAGSVRADVDIEHTATFIVAAVEGAISLTKSSNSRAVMESCARELNVYLESLRAVERAA